MLSGLRLSGNLTRRGAEHSRFESLIFIMLSVVFTAINIAISGELVSLFGTFGQII